MPFLTPWRGKKCVRAAGHLFAFFCRYLNQSLALHID